MKAVAVAAAFFASGVKVARKHGCGEKKARINKRKGVGTGAEKAAFALPLMARSLKPGSPDH
jgi:hypothetical protein